MLHDAIDTERERENVYRGDATLASFYVPYKNIRTEYHGAAARLRTRRLMSERMNERASDNGDGGMSGHLQLQLYNNNIRLTYTPHCILMPTAIA